MFKEVLVQNKENAKKLKISKAEIEFQNVTFALDSENEMQIQSALRYVMHGKTTVAIAHRLSTLRNMDRIIVMHKGKIIESGSHKQLLRSGGAYRKLWYMQTGGSIGE